MPIVADEARTFGMEGMFRQMGIYSAMGQLYDPATPIRSCITAKTKKVRCWRKVYQNQALSLRGWLQRLRTVPIIVRSFLFTFITPFRFPEGWRSQLGSWRFAGRGFLIGATAGQRQWRRVAASGRAQPSISINHSNCVTYDPTYAYELAVIIQDGLRRTAQSRSRCITTSPQ